MDKMINKKILASIIDNSFLKPYETKGDLTRFVNECINLGTNICINESRIDDAVGILKEKKARNILCAVIGFPHGSCTTYIKCNSTKEALKKGADEIDMVINMGFLKDIDKRFREDIYEVAKVVKKFNKESKKQAVLKVIIETCYLNDDEKIFASKTIKEIAKELKLTMFVKTSTGFGSGGATPEDVKLIKKVIGRFDKEKNPVGIKASGGVRTLSQVIQLIKASGYKADESLKDKFRIGTSAGKEILSEIDN